MAIWQACLWGLLGAALVEGLELYQAIHAEGGFPWQFRGRLKLGPYLVALLVRLGLGAALAAVFAASHQITGPIAAVTIGIAAPKILEQLARQATPAAPAALGRSEPAGAVFARQARRTARRKDSADAR